MVKKVTYNLNFLAKSIFELDEEHQKILRILARQDEDLIGINQTQITRIFGNTTDSLTRKTIHKKLFGTNKTMGLIPTEYVVQRKENKKRYGKSEVTFHLTFKGLFGALASGVPLKRIYIYKKFLNAVDHYITDTKLNKIIKEYYELQIQSFLLWHYIYGIQLRKLTTFQSYYSELDKREFSHTNSFGITLNPNIIRASREPIYKVSYDLDDYYVMHLVKKKQEENKEDIAKMHNVFSSYFIYKGIISLLRTNGKIPTTEDFLKPDFDIGDTREDIIFDKLINDWSIYIESVYQAKSLDDALFDDHYEIVNQPNVKFLPQGFYELAENDPKELEEVEKTSNVVFIPDITKKIKNILKEKDIQIDIPEKWDRPLNVYPF